MDCPLVQLAKYRQIQKKFEESGMVAIPVREWLRFFEALAFITRESGRPEIYCSIVGGHMVFSKAPIKQRDDLRPAEIEQLVCCFTSQRRSV